MIFVYYPRGYQTGGPEALHQLVDSIRRQGGDAYLTPMPGTENNPRVESYNIYDAPEARIVDDTGNTVVAPEIAGELLLGHPLSSKILWWLSLDNARTSGIQYYLPDFIHAAQSKYAYNSLSVRPYYLKMLSDYTIVEDFGFGYGERDIVVAYNAAKGAENVIPLLGMLPDVEFVGIQNMNRREVSHLLRRAAIYLDLGHHPGKDRMPREAALSGAVVITSRRGSANTDINISQKVNTTEEARLCIEKCLADLDAARASQAEYVEEIKHEKNVFDKEVSELFF